MRGARPWWLGQGCKTETRLVAGRHGAGRDAGRHEAYRPSLRVLWWAQVTGCACHHCHGALKGCGWVQQVFARRDKQRMGRREGRVICHTSEELKSLRAAREGGHASGDCIRRPRAASARRQRRSYDSAVGGAGSCGDDNEACTNDVADCADRAPDPRRAQVALPYLPAHAGVGEMALQGLPAQAGSAWQPPFCGTRPPRRSWWDCGDAARRRPSASHTHMRSSRGARPRLRPRRRQQVADSATSRADLILRDGAGRGGAEDLFLGAVLEDVGLPALLLRRALPQPPPPQAQGPNQPQSPRMTPKRGPLRVQGAKQGAARRRGGPGDLSEDGGVGRAGEGGAAEGVDAAAERHDGLGVLDAQDLPPRLRARVAAGGKCGSRHGRSMLHRRHKGAQHALPHKLIAVCEQLATRNSKVCIKIWSERSVWHLPEPATR